MSKLVVIIWWFAVVGSGWLLPLFRWSWLEIGFQRLVFGSADGNLFFVKLRLVGRLETGISPPTDT